MSKIKVVGSSQLHDLAEVQDSVILLANQYFWKHDRENLVKVKLPDGKNRLYRKESPMIIETIDGEFCRKTDCYHTEDGLWFSKTSPNVVKVGSTVTHKNFTVTINNIIYLKSDPLVVRVGSRGSERDYALKSSCVVLNEKMYGPNQWKVRTPAVSQVEGEWYLTSDCAEYLLVKDGTPEFILLAPHDKRAKNTREVFKAFKDRTNPQVNRYDFVFTSKEDSILDEQTGLYFHKELYEEQKVAINSIFEKQTLDTIAKAKEKFDKNYDDQDTFENNPKHWSQDFQTWGGKQHLFGHIGSPVISTAFTRTGGLRYCFGVEIETSGGLLNRRVADELGIEAVGDRSIGAAEYVTGILHGNSGLDHLELIARKISEYCMVDKRCGLHIHIGQIDEENVLRHPKINFDRQFAIAAIKLGSQIEKELYEILPPSRSPYNYHCNSIRRYEGINEENWREFLGTFIFGPREDEITKRGGVDMSQYSYGTSGHSKSSELSNWCGGRYKWLNLVRAYSASSSPTIEFRIFSGTTSFKRIYNYLLICLAFVNVAQNHYKEIMDKGFDLKGMLDISYAKHPILLEQVNTFIAKRKDRFKGRKIY